MDTRRTNAGRPADGETPRALRVYSPKDKSVRLVRVTPGRPGFGARTLLWLVQWFPEPQSYGERFEAMEGDALWKRSFGTEPMPYLPDHPDYGDDIKVQYFVYAVV